MTENIRALTVVKGYCLGALTKHRSRVLLIKQSQTNISTENVYQRIRFDKTPSITSVSVSSVSLCVKILKSQNSVLKIPLSHLLGSSIVALRLESEAAMALRRVLPSLANKKSMGMLTSSAPYR